MSLVQEGSPTVGTTRMGFQMVGKGPATATITTTTTTTGTTWVEGEPRGSLDLVFSLDLEFIPMIGTKIMYLG